MLRHRRDRSRAQRRGAPDYLANHAPSAEDTLFEGVKRLLPGHTLRWRDGDVDIERYWDLDVPEPAPEAASDENSLSEYRERLRESVRLRLMADVPLGMFLSGGIDSAAIAGMMSELVGDGSQDLLRGVRRARGERA